MSEVPALAFKPKPCVGAACEGQCFGSDVVLLNSINYGPKLAKVNDCQMFAFHIGTG